MKKILTIILKCIVDRKAFELRKYAISKRTLDALRAYSKKEAQSATPTAIAESALAKESAEAAAAAAALVGMSQYKPTKSRSRKRSADDDAAAAAAAKRVKLGP